VAAICAGALLAACARPVVAPGRAAYLDFCAGCHGRDAAGLGAMAQLVEAGVADLTGMSAANGGVFPMARVLNVMRQGTNPQDNTLAMPDFANVLGGRAAIWTSAQGEEIATTDTMLVLAEYLASVQR